MLVFRIIQHLLLKFSFPANTTILMDESDFYNHLTKHLQCSLAMEQSYTMLSATVILLKFCKIKNRNAF